jgi:hypothetical protein
MVWWHLDPLLGNDSETTRQRPLLGNSRKQQQRNSAETL